jgi:hypothetical protein
MIEENPLEQRSEDVEIVESTAGDIQAEILRGFLEAQGFKVFLSQEGAGHSVYAMTVGELGRVDILVPASQAEAARQVLEDYRAGKFEGTVYPPQEIAAEDQPDEEARNEQEKAAGDQPDEEAGNEQ